MAEGFLLQSGHVLEIDVDPGGVSTMERLGAGIANMEPSPNDEISQDKYYDGEGFGETDVISSQLVISLSGHRSYGDPAQDYIFGQMLETGPKRRTTLDWTLPDGGKYSGPVTIANISGPGGDAGAKGDIAFELHFNGKPEFVPAI